MTVVGSIGFIGLDLAARGEIDSRELFIALGRKCGKTVLTERLKDLLSARLKEMAERASDNADTEKADSSPRDVGGL